jgi:hypothetical protein
MQRNLFSPLAAVAVLFLLHSANVLAFAAPCGASADEAIAAAEKALVSNDDANQKHALHCLLEAVKDLNAHRAEAVSRDGNRFVTMPSGKHWAKPK